MATITELDGRTNLTGGADLSLNFKGSNHVNGFVIGSNTTGGDDNGSGIGLQANYGFSTRRVNLQTQVEHYDRGFVMDTAFSTASASRRAGATSTTASIPTRIGTRGSAGSPRSRSSSAAAIASRAATTTSASAACDSA